MYALQTFVDHLLAGDVFAAALEVFGVMPVPILALIVFGSIGIGYYMVQKTALIPAVMFILIGGTTIARAPTNFQSGIVALLVIALAGIGYVLLQRVTTT